ncbi:MAG: hypothetical protein HY924_14655 [Elusimicrobia bacterium]|nr:hypothetical protein [Elusimicrobiota bacterium]
MSFGLALTGLHAAVLLTAAAAAVVGSGRRALSLLGITDAAGPERTWAGASLGLGFLSIGTMGLAFLGLLKVWPAALLLAGLLVWGRPELKPALREVRGPWEAPACLAAACAWGLALWWVCLMPPHQYDSLVYHLALPETYVREGRLVSPSHLLYSHFPQNGEMLFSLALLLKSDALAQMFMWLSTVLCLGWVFAAVKRELGPGPAWLALGLAGTHTALMLLAAITYVEPLVMLWTCSAVLACWRWLADSRNGQGAKSWLHLSAVFSGLALGTKYTAGATAGLLALTALIRPFLAQEGKTAWKQGLKDSVLYSSIVLALFLPWLVKNSLVIGNPVFPFLYSWFPMTGSGWGAETAQRYFRILAEYGHGESWLKDLVTLPYQLLFRFSRYGGGMDVLGCLGWTPVLAAGVLALWPALKAGACPGPEPSRTRSFLRFVLVYCGLHFLIWFATGTVLRFLTAAAPLLALLASAGLSAVWNASSRVPRFLIAGLGIALTGVNLGYFLFVHRVLETDRVLLGRETREAYLERRLDYYACASWCRESLGPNDRILLVGEQRAYYLGKDHVASTVNAPNHWVALAEEAASPEDLSAKLKAEGLTTVLFVPGEMARLFPALGPLTERGLANLAGLPGSGKLKFQGRRCGVFSL